MTAMTTAGCTPSRELGLVAVLLAATAVAIEGALCFVNTSGYGTSNAGADHICMGVFDQSADNSAGVAGATYAMVRRNRQFLLCNDTVNPVTQADFGVSVWAVDNQTVSTNDGGGTRSLVGRFMGFDFDQPTMLWVEIA